MTTTQNPKPSSNAKGIAFVLLALFILGMIFAPGATGAGIIALVTLFLIGIPIYFVIGIIYNIAKGAK